MQKENTKRRSVLKAIGGATVLSGVVGGTSGKTPDRTSRDTFAGVSYDLKSGEVLDDFRAELPQRTGDLQGEFNLGRALQLSQTSSISINEGKLVSRESLASSTDLDRRLKKRIPSRSYFRSYVTLNEQQRSSGSNDSQQELAPRVRIQTVSVDGNGIAGIIKPTLNSNDRFAFAAKPVESGQTKRQARQDVETTINSQFSEETSVNENIKKSDGADISDDRSEPIESSVDTASTSSIPDENEVGEITHVSDYQPDPPEGDDLTVHLAFYGAHEKPGYGHSYNEVPDNNEPNGDSRNRFYVETWWTNLPEIECRISCSPGCTYYPVTGSSMNLHTGIEVRENQTVAAFSQMLPNSSTQDETRDYSISISGPYVPVGIGVSPTPNEDWDHNPYDHLKYDMPIENKDPLSRDNGAGFETDIEGYGEDYSKDEIKFKVYTQIDYDLSCSMNANPVIHSTTKLSAFRDLKLGTGN